MFAVPYEREFTLIGTTDVECHGQPQDLEIGATETGYLCAIVNRHFTRQIRADREARLDAWLGARGQK